MDRKSSLAASGPFETSRLILRRVEFSDAEALFDCLKDEETARYLNFPSHKSLDVTKAVIAQGFMSAMRLTSWGIVEKSSHQFIGTISFDVRGDIAEFAYMLHKSYWGRGYMVEAMSCLRDFCFNQLEIKVICATHYVENQKSGHVMKKVDMTKLGEVYEPVKKEKTPVLCAYWAMTAEDYALQK